MAGSRNESRGPDGQGDEQRNEEAPSFVSFIVIEISAKHGQSVVFEVCVGNEMRSVCEKQTEEM